MATKATTHDAGRFLADLFTAEAADAASQPWPTSAHEPSPTAEAAPCRRCGSVGAWMTADGRIVCGCAGKPPAGALKLLLVDLPSPHWADYAAERHTHDRRNDIAAPCRRCGLPVAWRTLNGRMACRSCEPPPPATMLFLVAELPEGRRWVRYEDEFAARLHRLAGLPDVTEDDSLDDWDTCGELWTEATPTCPTCKSAATWEDGRGDLRCMKCDPPRRARKVLSAKTILEASREGRLGEAAKARRLANQLRPFAD